MNSTLIILGAGCSFKSGYRRYFPDFDDTEALYYKTVLNSGLCLVDPKKLEIDLNKFSFLKLHGSAGFYGFSEQIYPSTINGEVEHIHSIPDPKNPIPITDAEFFYPKDPADPLHSERGNCIVIRHTG
jgi:acetoacetate decarboxylase